MSIKKWFRVFWLWCNGSDEQGTWEYTFRTYTWKEATKKVKNETNAR
jgi:hypothetical protein